MRDTPSKDGKIIATLKYGQAILVDEELATLVTIDGRSGQWLSAHTLHTRDSSFQRGYAFGGYLKAAPSIRFKELHGFSNEPEASEAPKISPNGKHLLEICCGGMGSRAPYLTILNSQSKKVEFQADPAWDYTWAKWETSDSIRLFRNLSAGAPRIEEEGILKLASGVWTLKIIAIRNVETWAHGECLDGCVPTPKHNQK